MTLEIRPLRDEDVEQGEFITNYAFNNPDRYDLARAVEQSRQFYPPDWALGSFEDGEMTALVRTIPFALRINGHGLSFGGVGPVVSLPQHRRKGHVAALLKAAMERMRDQGQTLSGLHTPHPTLYQRYGWEIATVRRVYTFAPKEVTLKAQPSQRGRTRMLSEDDWPELDRIYRRYGAERNSHIHRGEVWWRHGVLFSSRPNKADAAIWVDDQGEPQGYVIFVQQTKLDPDFPRFWVREVFALTSDAYLNLIQYILRHDLPEKITWTAPPDDPLMSAVDDARFVKVEEEYDLMLRIVDVEHALRQRPPASEAAATFTMRIEDPSAPWNEKTWRVEAADGAVSIEAVDGDADLSMTATTLAPLYNGFLTPTAAAMTGRVRAQSEDALAAADAFFAVKYPPFCADGF